MSGTLMVLTLWAAAIYRLALSVRTETTVWRTAFTACAVGVAIGATTSVFGDQTIDAWSGAWNLAMLLTRLALTCAATAASVYVLTLRRKLVPAAAVMRRFTVGVALVVVQVAAWAMAAIHDRELSTTAEVYESSISGSVLAVAF